MQCKHCQKDFIPKQQYCSTNCRVYAHLKKEPLKDKEVKKILSPKEKPDKLLKQAEKLIIKKTVDGLYKKRGELNAEDYI